MLEHTVYFWLREDLDEAQRKAFEAALDQLLTSPHVAQGRWGRPAGTPRREVSEMSWDYALHTSFAEMPAHDAYQETCPIHKAFIDNGKDKWTRVMVLDTAIAS